MNLEIGIVDQRYAFNLLNFSRRVLQPLLWITKKNIISLASDDIFKCPFVYPFWSFKLVQVTKKEKENFKKYITNGGFVICR